ncbi:hypothetical protein [Pantoea sp. VS1]|uniref:hypothetical protein n=1 Tax=Pantoea sp. VS1 TaxID=2003658 RepID=UPI001130E83C|nr:hypothetical protein [Pantoea sp. VS1]
MKGQDILLLLKLMSLERHEKTLSGNEELRPLPETWQDWEITEEEELKQKGIVEFSEIAAYHE